MESTTSTNDNFDAYLETAFKSIQEQQAKNASKNVPQQPPLSTGENGLNSNEQYHEYLETLEFGNSLFSFSQTGVKPKPESPPNPMPLQSSIDPTTVINELKSKIAQLEQSIYGANDEAMKKGLEDLLAKLATAQLDQTLQALAGLNHITQPSLLSTYERYLGGRQVMERIVLLCAKQFRFFFTHYLKTQDDCESAQSSKVELRKFMGDSTTLLINLIKYGSDDLVLNISRDSIHELASSLLPFIVWDYTIQKKTIYNHQYSVSSPIYSYGETVYCFLSDILESVHDQLGSFKDTSFNHHSYGSGLRSSSSNSNVSMIMMAVLLRLLRDLTSKALKNNNNNQKKEPLVDESIEALTGVIKSYLYVDYFKGSHLKSIIYEIYGLFELYSRKYS